MKNNKTIDKWKEFNERNREAFLNSIIDWPSEISTEHIKEWDGIIGDVIELDDLDERIDEIDKVLQSLEENYPNLYDDLEDDIKDIAI